MSLDFFLGMFPKLLHGTWITLVILLLSGLIGNALAVGVAAGAGIEESRS